MFHFKCIILCCIIIPTVLCSHLSSFRPEAFGIKSYLQPNKPKNQPSANHSSQRIVNEILHLLNSHFINKTAIGSIDWEGLDHDALTSHNPHKLIQEALIKLGDPYTKLLINGDMVARQRAIRGEMVSVGISLLRKDISELFSFPHTKLRLKTLIPDIFSKAKNTIANLMYRQGLSRIQSRLLLLHSARFLGYVLCPVISSYSTLRSRRADFGLNIGVVALCFLGILKFLNPILRPLEINDIAESLQSLGVAVGNNVVSINGRIVFFMPLKKVRSLLESGSPGDSITVGIEQYNATSGSKIYRELGLQKDIYVAPKVTCSLVPTLEKAKFGYIAIEEFTDHSLLEFTTALSSLKQAITSSPSSSLNGLVIDLRGNPGGPLAQALEIASLFLKRGTILTKMISGGKVESYRSLNRNVDSKMPLLLLVDSATASAAEILAAALKENNRATVFGGRTLGKNKAQAVVMLSDGSGLIFSIREYMTPHGRSMASGVTPDTHIEGIRLLDKSDIILEKSTNMWQIRSK